MLKYLSWILGRVTLLLVLLGSGDFVIGGETGAHLPDERALLPINVEDRRDVQALALTQIGDFGRLRVARPGIPAHYHTGIDIKRPGERYDEEPIFPILPGEVITVRFDGAFAQIIINHKLRDGQEIWSVYEHIAGIRVEVGERVSPMNPIARFMNRDELDAFGWQFDHFHLEVMLVPPYLISATERHPQRHYATYGLTCFSESELHERYADPLLFLKQVLVVGP